MLNKYSRHKMQSARFFIRISNLYTGNVKPMTSHIFTKWRHCISSGNKVKSSLDITQQNYISIYGKHMY